MNVRPGAPGKTTMPAPVFDVYAVMDTSCDVSEYVVALPDTVTVTTSPADAPDPPGLPPHPATIVSALISMSNLPHRFVMMHPFLLAVWTSTVRRRPERAIARHPFR